MGFKEFEFMNSAFLTKQAWRLFQNPNALWCRVLKNKYFPNEEFLQASRRRRSYWAWSSILYGRDVVINSGAWLIANGEVIDIRKNNWVVDGE